MQYIYIERREEKEEVGLLHYFYLIFFYISTSYKNST